jgi:TRAP transporter 4TM/12TM fusion protein
MEKMEKVEPKQRNLTGFPRTIADILLVLIPLTAIVGVLDLPSYFKISLFLEQYVALIVGFMLAATFFLVPGKKGNNKLPFYDVIFALISLVIGLYVCVNFKQIGIDIGILKMERIILGTLAVVLLVEASRRHVGIVFVIIACVVIGYALFAGYMPAGLRTKSIPFSNLMTYLYLDSNGILGVPIMIGCTLVLVFILFGTVINAIGVDKLFNDFALAVTGKYRGGPAKASVFASGLFGMISGSAVANVVTTGSFTIPLMKRMGFSPQFAGAVEAVSSTGGLIMPPIMGAAAFLMATYIGIPYRDVAIAAFVPAILYYFAVFVQVDSRAAKKGLKGLEKSQIPKIRDVFRVNWPFVIPFLVLGYTLFVLWMEPESSGLMSIGACLVLAFIMKKRTGITFKKVFIMLKTAGSGLLEIGVTCGVAGIIIGTLSITGLGFSFSSLLVNLAQGNLFLLLLLAAIGASILGMGMTVTASYLLIAAIAAPALQKMGVQPLLAHFFVFYYGVLSFLTPPVCLACYAAASLAGTSMLKTAGQAMKLAVVAYLVPFIFAYKPALLLQGSIVEIVEAIVFAAVGVYFLARALEGYLFRPLGPVQRIVLAIGGVVIMVPGYAFDLIGILISIPIILYEWKQAKSERLSLDGANVQPNG